MHACLFSHFSCVQLLATPWTPLSMVFSRQKYWTGFLCPPPGNLPNPGIETVSLKSPALAVGFFIASATWKAQIVYEELQLVLFEYTLSGGAGGVVGDEEIQRHKDCKGFHNKLGLFLIIITNIY